ncbi:hypothetical protein [Entomomonas asaccharolytica]|uniref:Uncharacterized protein n=1 Tax=Entomomonas asaccharolytica TaxID=2785331 RepID=A0A974ND64_9GAMM|nr:hypothetical protein [Entomomonas asaccharolytica]QQP84540.1 hypothetical protein JHT90_08945 [Entomomonas asaccharolytica]
MKKLLYIFTTVLLLLTTKNIFATEQSVDVTKFDIAGVKLGMTIDQAVKAITSTLNVNKSQIKFREMQANNMLNLSSTQKSIYKITGKAQIISFALNTNAGNYSVEFLPNVVNGKNEQMVVSLIRYTMKASADNMKALTESTIKKYGQPTTKNNYWCSSPPQSGCIYGNQPYLHLSPLNVILISGTNYYEKAMKEYLNTQKTTKPVF